MNATKSERYERIMQSEVIPGDTLIIEGYEWVVDSASYVSAAQCNGLSMPVRDKGCYRFHCHWSGNGVNPRFHNDDITLGQREDLPVTRLVK